MPAAPSRKSVDRALQKAPYDRLLFFLRTPPSILSQRIRLSARYLFRPTLWPATRDKLHGPRREHSCATQETLLPFHEDGGCGPSAWVSVRQLVRKPVSSLVLFSLRVSILDFPYPGQAAQSYFLQGEAGEHCSPDNDSHMRSRQ